MTIETYNSANNSDSNLDFHITTDYYTVKSLLNSTYLSEEILLNDIKYAMSNSKNLENRTASINAIKYDIDVLSDKYEHNGEMFDLNPEAFLDFMNSENGRTLFNEVYLTRNEIIENSKLILNDLDSDNFELRDIAKDCIEYFGEEIGLSYGELINSMGQTSEGNIY